MVKANEFKAVGAATVPERSRGMTPASSPTIAMPPADTMAELTRLRDALEQSERQRQALLAGVSDLIFELRKDGVIASFRAPKDNEFQITTEVVVGRRVMELLPSQLGQLALHYIEKTLRTGQPQHFSCQYLFPGRLRYFDVRLAVSGSGLVLAVVRDMTDRETLEKEVVESSNRVQMRIGQDIHDGLGQHLTGISFLSRALEKNLAAKNIPEAAEAGEISRMVLAALAQTRNLARGLFPVEIECTELVHALKELAVTTEQLFNISCSVDCDDSLVIHGEAACTHLFRLAQEAINNAVKHGQSHRVAISLQREGDGDRATLSITDDGVGISPEGGRKTGLGLRIMNYRAQKVGGTLDIQPGASGGTVVTCSFNLNNDEN